MLYISSNTTAIRIGFSRNLHACTAIRTDRNEGCEICSHTGVEENSSPPGCYAPSTGRVFSHEEEKRAILRNVVNYLPVATA